MIDYANKRIENHLCEDKPSKIVSTLKTMGKVGLVGLALTVFGTFAHKNCSHNLTVGENCNGFIEKQGDNVILVYFPGLSGLYDKAKEKFSYVSDMGNVVSISDKRYIPIVNILTKEMECNLKSK